MRRWFGRFCSARRASDCSARRAPGRAALVLGAVGLALAAWQPAAAESAREAALERRVEQLESKLDAMTREMKALITAVKAGRAEAAEAKKVASAGDKPVVRSGGPDVALEISGQVNRAILFANDGNGFNTYHVDNDNSSTRFRINGRARLDEDFTVGATAEVEFESNSSGAVNQLSNEGVGPNNFKERILEVWAEHASFGKLYIGQGNTASNGTSELDLSGTKVIGYSAVEDMAGGLLFARKDIAGTPGVTSVSLASPTVGAAFTNMDGLSRDDRIRYDTPRVMGVRLSASHSAGDDSDLALRYAGKLGPVKLAAGFGFAHIADSRNQYAGSVSVLHESGLNLTYAAGVQLLQTKGSGDSPDFWYLKLGYLFNPFSFGATALAVDYVENSDIKVAGDYGSSYGFLAVQNVKKAGTEFYVGVRNYAYDQNGANFDDILAVMMGARIKF